MLQPTTKPMRQRRSKLPTEVVLTGHTGELLVAELVCFRSEILEMKSFIKQQNAFLKQVVANTQYPLKPYTVADFTAMFGLSKRTQENYRKAGKLRYMKLGQKILYTAQHILEFIQLHEVNDKKQSD